ncbi:hypothetical protein Hanom_Chr02g00121431 [Helianthus anomalus]
MLCYISCRKCYIQGAPGQPDKYSLVQHKHCSITISNFRFNGCLILTSFVGGKHLQLLESSTQFLRDFRNYFLAKRKSPYQYIQRIIEAACAAHPIADVFINFASFRTLYCCFIKTCSQTAYDQSCGYYCRGCSGFRHQGVNFVREVVIGPATVGVRARSVEYVIYYYYKACVSTVTTRAGRRNNLVDNKKKNRSIKGSWTVTVTVKA